VASRVAGGVVALLVLAAPLRAVIEQDVHGVVSLRALAVSGGDSWVDGGLGKLRFDDDDEPLSFGAAHVAYRARLTPILALRAAASAYADGPGSLVDLDEAYLELRPVPRSAWRLVARGGAFHAPFSLENTGVGWTSPYTLSYSSVNGWFGEELRTIGADLQATHEGAAAGSPHDFGLLLGAFQANDPAGALLSWRGWAIGDRPTRLFERLPLAPLPGFGSTGLFFVQEAFEEPFKELDGRTGWYAGAQWDYLDRSRLRVQHYDNRGDALVAKDGQWTWRTELDHAGWHLRLPSGSEAIAQVVRGETEMDGFDGPFVYADFGAWFLLLSHGWGRQRASLRYDDFWVHDRDHVAGDPNQEDGHAWTAAWFLDGPRGRWGAWRIGAEALRIQSWRPAREILGEPVRRTEKSLQLVGEWRF
ncbi:MAG TPA: hypothetical protein VN923_18475, partial [Thermoanaerobaculia bacterium]|nr:hypothetical protein [Thermoanaerobaculia bacterium]